LPETKRKKKPVFGYADPHTGAVMRGCDFVQDTEDNHHYIYHRQNDTITSSNRTRRNYAFRCVHVKADKLCTCTFRNEDNSRQFHECKYEKPLFENILFEKLIPYEPRKKVSLSSSASDNCENVTNNSTSKLPSVTSGVAQFFGRAVIPFRAARFIRPLLELIAKKCRPSNQSIPVHLKSEFDAVHEHSVSSASSRLGLLHFFLSLKAMKAQTEKAALQVDSCTILHRHITAVTTHSVKHIDLVLPPTGDSSSSSSFI
jgi:hypothetical protein